MSLKIIFLQYVPFSNSILIIELLKSSIAAKEIEVFFLPYSIKFLSSYEITHQYLLNVLMILDDTNWLYGMDPKG